MSAALALAFLAIVWSAICVPLLVFGARGKRPLPFALGVGAWSGLCFGGAGFMWGASIPDESAGAIAVTLFGICALVGAPPATFGAWWWFRRRTRGAEAAPAE